MARDGSGTYSLPATMAVASQQASSTTVNTIMSDVAQALTDSVNKDGTKAFAANQSHGGYKITSLGAGTALTDAAQLSQVQKGNVAQATTVAGTVDAITLAFTPAITSYTSGMRFRWVSGGANTSATPTINIDTLGTKTCKKNPGGAALVAGDMGASGTVHEAMYNGTDIILLNPVVNNTQLGAAASGAVTSSGLTMATDRLLGRDTASTGAIEELSVGAGLSIASSTLALSGPAFFAYRTTDQASIADATNTKAQYSSEDFDTNTNYDAATNYRFTPTVAGYYHFTHSCQLNGTGMVGGVAEIYKNGAMVFYGAYSSATSTPHGSIATGLLYMNGSTDYVEAYVWGNVTSGTVTLSGGQTASYFCGHFVRG